VLETQEGDQGDQVDHLRDLIAFDGPAAHRITGVIPAGDAGPGHAMLAESAPRRNRLHSVTPIP